MQTFRKIMYMVCDKKGKPVLNTLSETKSKSISEFLSNSQTNYTWNQVKQFGWIIKKYDVDFQEWNTNFKNF